MIFSSHIAGAMVVYQSNHRDPYRNAVDEIVLGAVCEQRIVSLLVHAR